MKGLKYHPEEKWIVADGQRLKKLFQRQKSKWSPRLLKAYMKDKPSDHQMAYLHLLTKYLDIESRTHASTKKFRDQAKKMHDDLFNRGAKFNLASGMEKPFEIIDEREFVRAFKKMRKKAMTWTNNKDMAASLKERFELKMSLSTIKGELDQK